jgi:DnaJ-class molecular chaperone
MTIYKCPKCGLNITCSRCKGKGYLPTKMGAITVHKETCPVCEGWGKDRNHKCAPKRSRSGVKRVSKSGPVININLHNENRNSNKG